MPASESCLLSFPRHHYPLAVLAVKNYLILFGDGLCIMNMSIDASALVWKRLDASTLMSHSHSGLSLALTHRRHRSHAELSRRKHALHIHTSRASNLETTNSQLPDPWPATQCGIRGKGSHHHSLCRSTLWRLHLQHVNLFC